MKIQVRDMTKHLRLFNTMIEGELFKNISYMKKPELEKNFNKYFKAEDYKGKTIYMPQWKGKINLPGNVTREKFHAIAPKGGMRMRTKAKKEAEKKEEPPKKRKILIKKKPVEKYESKKSNAADPAVKAKIDKLRKKGR
jgi:hypothetical protein